MVKNPNEITGRVEPYKGKKGRRTKFEEEGGVKDERISKDGRRWYKWRGGWVRKGKVAKLGYGGWGGRGGTGEVRLSVKKGYEGKWEREEVEKESGKVVVSTGSELSEGTVQGRT